MTAVCCHAHSKNCLDLICVCEFNVTLWKIKAMFGSLGWKSRHNPTVLTFHNTVVKFNGAESNMF